MAFVRSPKLRPKPPPKPPSKRKLRRLLSDPMSLTAAQAPAGIRNNPGNITAQADGKPRYAGEIDSWVGSTSGLTYAIFDSREMGLRAMFREFTTKLQRHKGDVELAILEYLGGGREGTKEDRIKRARRHNDDPEAYARRAQEAYDNGVKYGGNLYTGLQGLVARAVLEENLKPEHRDWYLKDPTIIAEAEKLAGIDVPTHYSLNATRKAAIALRKAGEK